MKYRTTREKEIGKEFNATIEKLYQTVSDTAYMEKCIQIHIEFIDSIKKNPLHTYKNLIINKNKTQPQLEAVVLILLKKVFQIEQTEMDKYKRISERFKIEEAEINREIEEFNIFFNKLLYQFLIYFLKIDII